VSSCKEPSKTSTATARPSGQQSSPSTICGVPRLPSRDLAKLANAVEGEVTARQLVDPDRQHAVLAA
jgi:hypothetical protein